MQISPSKTCANSFSSQRGSLSRVAVVLVPAVEQLATLPLFFECSSSEFVAAFLLLAAAAAALVFLLLLGVRGGFLDALVGDFNVPFFAMTNVVVKHAGWCACWQEKGKTAL